MKLLCNPNFAGVDPTLVWTLGSPGVDDAINRSPGWPGFKTGVTHV